MAHITENGNMISRAYFQKVTRKGLWNNAPLLAIEQRPGLPQAQRGWPGGLTLLWLKHCVQGLIRVHV